MRCLFFHKQGLDPAQKLPPPEVHVLATRQTRVSHVRPWRRRSVCVGLRRKLPTEICSLTSDIIRYTNNKMMLMSSNNADDTSTYEYFGI